MPNETVAGLMISIDANTVKLRSELDRARAATRETSRQMKSDMTEARAGIKQLGEEIGINLNRHLVSFLAKLPGASIFAEAFPIAAIAGVGMAFVEAGKRAYEFFEKTKAVAGEIGEAMQKMRSSTLGANDELSLANAKIAEQIAKLEHKPINALAIALAEARVEADKLSESLGKDIQGMMKLLLEKEVGPVGALVTGQQETSGAKAMEKRHLDALAEIDNAEAEAMRTAKTADQANATHSKFQIERLAALDAAIKENKDNWNQLHDAQMKLEKIGDSPEVAAQGNGALMTIYGSAGHEFESMRDSLGLMDQSTKLKQGLAGADAKVEAQKRYGEKIAEMVKDNQFLTEMNKKGLEELVETWTQGEEDIQKHRKALEDDANRDSVFAAEQGRRRAEEMSQAAKVARESASGAYERTGQSSALRVELGMESPSARTHEMQDALQKKRQFDQESFDQELSLWQKGSTEYDRILGERTKADEEYFKQLADLQKEAIEQGWSAPLMDLARQWTNWQGVFKQTIDSTLNGVNGELVRMMTTQYRRGDWKNATKPIFTGLATSGLQGAEGALFKAVGGKLGTKGNPMYTISANALAEVTHDPLAGTIKADGSFSSGGVGGFLGTLAKFGKFFGFMAEGGTMSPGGFYLTGERGPELINVGSTSRIHNARDTSKMMGGSSGHTFNIDARGAHDPVATGKQINKALEAALPMFGAATIHAQRDMDARRPNIGR